MATVISRTFDMAHGALRLQVKDAALGNVTSHTIYLLKPDGTVNDATALEAAILTEQEAQAVALKAALQAAGWQQGGS